MNLYRMVLDYLNELAYIYEEASVINELQEINGKEWVEACINDPECLKTIKNIARESIRLQQKETMQSPDNNRRKYRAKVLGELIAKLKQIGVKIWCEEIDAGELGTYYKDCYIMYKGEVYSISEDIGEIN